MAKFSSPLIAVVGMSGVFPKANGIDNFWRNIVDKVDGAAEIPADRWVAPLDWVYSPSPEPDMAYSRRACLVEDFRFNPSGLHLNQDFFLKLDPLHQWVLHVCRDAFENCRLSEMDRSRIGVILAAIALPTDASSKISRNLLGQRLIEPNYTNQMSGPVSMAESLCGRVVSFPATVVSHALRLGGASYTLDAACASSLYSIKLACDELQSNRADAMLAGGVSRADCLYTQIGFSQLRALSASGRCAPFDRSADGLVVGEGAGVMVLKRLKDAVAQGDTIYGVIHGIGLSNDMRGNLLAPESAGQVRAMQMAYAQAGWHPHWVDYIECHGAGTPVGDTTELQSLRDLWGAEGWEKSQCGIGSIKSMIGHLLTGAGAAGMIKSLLALHHKTLPPSLNFELPPVDSPLIDSPFRVQKDARPWPRRPDGTPRRAAVSAFGFGGINAHVLVEEWRDSRLAGQSCTTLEVGGQHRGTDVKSSAAAIVGLDITLGSIKSVQEFQEAVFNGRPALTSPPPGRWRTSGVLDKFLEISPLDGITGSVSAPGFKDENTGLPGGFIDRISIKIGEFRIPPGEIPDILPQQLIMLQKAAGAMTDAGMPLTDMRERMGTVIGIGFDYQATDFHLRWALPMLAAGYQELNGLKIPRQTLDQWLGACRDDCGPPLTATRTLGALGGIVASRIARELRFGGPSFVVSAEEASGLRAMEIAMRMLQSGEVDAMLVGAVDLNCDERNMATIYTRLGLSAKGRIRPFDQNADGTLPGEGAVAMVIKRLEDAISDKDRIYAVVKGVGSAGGQTDADLRPGISTYSCSLSRALDDAGTQPGQISFFETHGSGIPAQDSIETNALNAFFDDKGCRDGDNSPIAIGALKPIVGHTGAVSGLASLAKTALSLYHHLLPPLVNFDRPGQPQWMQGRFHMPVKSRYWAHDKISGPGKACVAAITSDGQCMHAVLGQAHDDHRLSPMLQQRPGHHQSPMGALPFGLFVIKGGDHEHLLQELNRLENLIQTWSGLPDTSIMGLAQDWHERTRTGSQGNHNLAIVTDSIERLEAYLDVARQSAATGSTRILNGRGGVCYLPDMKLSKSQMAFVYPGSGNHYVGMGRSLGVHWPEVLREMNAATDRFKAQMLPQWYDPYRVDWSAGWQQEAYKSLVADPLNTIFGQVLFGSQMTGLLRRFGLRPDAAIGYSLGESSALFALGAWPDRGAMLKRLERSELFKTQLAGPCESARRAWKITHGQPFTWRVAAVNRSRQVVDEAIANLPQVRRLIVNTPSQCVIGGAKEHLEAAVTAMACEAVYLDGVVTVHCDAARPVADAYKDLHRFPTTPVKDVRFYSCAFGKAYELTSEAAAESITRQALEGFDFTRTIQQAYSDGVRIFVEIGPHCSCTRMIDQILTDRLHLAVAANHRSEEEPLTLLKSLGTLAAAGIEIDLDFLYGDQLIHREIPLDRGQKNDRLEVPMKGASLPDQSDDPKAIVVPVGAKPLSLHLAFPEGDRPSARSGQETGSRQPPVFDTAPEVNVAGLESEIPPASRLSLDFDTLIARFNENVESTAKAHEQFLDLSRQITARYGETFELRNQLLSVLKVDGRDAAAMDSPSPSTTTGLEKKDPEVINAVFNRDQCMEFAIGSVAEMLGPDFAIVDTFKARVRLPDEPLMLVDRIIHIEGERLGLGAGRVVTEHDVRPGAWYLDGGRAPVCISVEAGQADLFLCAWLGIDHKVRGERTYRLLDARIKFHRGLPRPGETIRYDIHIDKFVRQEETYLFFFRFEGHIGSEHLITMTDGCAGFFTEAEVRNSGGIILTDEDKAPVATLNGAPYEPLLALTDGTYCENRLEALRRGDAAGCFGPAFEGIRLPPALCLPAGRMRLIHRIVALQPWGGRFGKGYICAEADIHPDDWFLTCHFVDDMVMPGTLMYECCAHTLRALLIRLGWVTDKENVAYEPVQGLDCRLKCRGPVTPATAKVHYAVEIKEIGYRPEPYVIADAHMYADGRYIVFFKDMSMQMTGLSRQEILDFWNRRSSRESDSRRRPAAGRIAPLFTREQILAFAVGKPSKAFGQPYEIFDQNRVIARLPGPPYCFMDRITAIEPRPWVLQPDGWVEAQYDVPADAWYFSADRSGIMPFCVLLEIALQPCGWLAAFAGSALHSENDLKFRNLGGRAVIHANLRPEDLTLTMRTRMTKVSEAADMIIEHFDFQVLNRGIPIYTGTTYFGFFTAKALAQQVGLREEVYAPDEGQRQSTISHSFAAAPPLTPQSAPKGVRFQCQGLQIPAKALCMIDDIELFSPEGGPHGLGFVRGCKTVDNDEWFFKAHFYQDPVCPGSLGIESFLQLIKYAAMARWPHLKNSHRFELVCANEHQWTYRGQVIPSNRKVTVDAVITGIEEGSEPLMMADGSLMVDGISIYKMVGYGLRLVPLD